MSINFNNPMSHVHESDFDNEPDDVSVRVTVSSLQDTISASQLEDALLDGMVSDDLHEFAEREALRLIGVELDLDDPDDGVENLNEEDF